VAAELLKRGVIVKPWTEPKYAGFVRASIGSEEENDLFLAALADALESVRYPGVAAVR
jgi:histidinol-phosphate aminotransferase